MDGRMNFTLDRGRFLPTTHASATLGTLSHSYDGSSGAGALRHPLADLGRTGTPSTLASLGQFGGRYFPSSSLPFHTGAGYVMDSYLSSRSQTGADGLKPSLHQYPQYWAAQSEGLARQYGLAGSVYSPYLPLLHGADPMAAVYPHAAAAAALAQAQAPYHRIYDLRTDPNYGGLAMAGAQPTLYSSSLHSPATEPMLLQAPAPSLLTGEGKSEGQTSLEKLSLAVESAGGGVHPVSKKHSIKAEPGATKTQDNMRSVSGTRASEGRREKKSSSSDSKRDVKDNKDSNVPKEMNQGGHAKSKKESSGSHTSPSSKTGVVLPRAEKIEGKKTSENRTACDKRVASPQKKSAREAHRGGEMTKPKAVVLSSAVTERKTEDGPPGSSPRTESSVTLTSSQSTVAVASSQSSAKVTSSQSSPTVTCSQSSVTVTKAVTSLQSNVLVPSSQSNVPLTSSLSAVALTTVTFTTSESKTLMTSTSSGPSVVSIQPATRMTAAVASNNNVSRTDASEYLGASSGPYHTVYSYTQQNKPVREGSKVHATTVTPEVGTLPSPVVPTCTTTVIQAKSTGDEVKCKVEGSRSSCCAMTTTTSSRGQSKCGEGHTQSAKKKTQEGKHRSASDKGSKATNLHEKLTEQLNNNLTPKYEGSGYVTSGHQVIFPQPQGVGIDCCPRDMYGSPLPFPSKTLPFSGAPATPYDASLRPMDLSSPKEKKRKECVKSPSESSRNSSDSESGKNSKKLDSASTVPYRDIIHEYGQPRSRVTLLETHLPADKTPSSSPGMAAAGSKMSVTPSTSPRLWYDYNMAGQQMVMSNMPGRYMYPYGQIQPYYPIPPEGSAGASKVEPSSVQSASPVPSTPAGHGSGSAESGKESHDDKRGSADKAESGKTQSEKLPGKDRVSPVCKHPVTPVTGKSDSDSNSATPTRQMSPACNKPQPVAPYGNNSEDLTNSRYVAPLRNCPTVTKTTKHLPLGSVKPSGPGLKTCKDHSSGEENVAISGSGIPVGIAVARQRQDTSKDVAKDEAISDVSVTSETCTYSQERSEREEFLREQKELLDNRSLISTTATSNSGDVRTELSANLVVTGGNVLSTGTGWRDGGDATRQYPTSQWIQAGPTINPALWVGQAAFGMPPTLPATPALDTSHLPFTASGGFKLAQDPVTGQLFLIPTANLSNLAYASTPFQHGTSTAQTVMAAQPFTQMAMSGQPITAAPPPVDPSPADQPDKEVPSSPQEGVSSEDPQDGCSDEGQSTQSNSPHRAASDSAGEQHGAEEESSAGPGETTPTNSEGEKADCPTVPIAPQTAYIAGYASMGAGQTYATYSYPHPQISYLYDPNLLSTYSMPMPTALPEAAPVSAPVAAPIAAPVATSVAAPVAAVKPECPAVRSQGTSPIVVSSANTPTIPTATVAAFSEALPPTESEVKEDSKTEVEPEEDAEKALAESSTPPSVQEEQPAPKEQGPSVVPAPTAPVESTETKVDNPVISESIGAAKVLQKLKHSKVKKEKKKKDPNKNSDKKAEKKSEKKHSCDKKTNSDKQSHSEKKKDKSGKVKKSKLKSKNSDQKKTEESSAEEGVNYNPYTDPQILQAADGLELLSALAEKWSKCSPVEEEEKPEVSKPDVIDEYEFTDNPVIDINRNYSPSKTGKRTCYADSEKLSTTPSKKDVADLPPVFVSTGLAWPTGPDTMDAMELEIRMRLAELQRRYKQKQRELSKLHPKKDKEEEEKSLTKRGPGRPRKRKFLSRKSDSHNTSASDSGKSSSYKEPVAKKKKLVEKLVDRVFRKTGRDKKSKKNKALGLVSSSQKHGSEVAFDKRDTGLIGNKSLSEDSGLLQNADGHSQEATKVKSKSKSKDGKKQKSHSSHDKSSKKANLGMAVPGKEKKSKKILKKSCLSGDSADVNTGNTSQGVSDSSEGDCGLGPQTKFSGTSAESTPSGGKKKKRKVEEGVLGDKNVVSVNAPRQDSKQGPPVTKRESDTDHSDPTSVTKRRKPGRPKKYCNPGKSAGNTETIVAKKPKHIGMMKYKSKERKIDMKAQEKKMKLENSSVLKPLYLEEEWSLRRSERIFLSEPSPQPSPNGPLGSAFGLKSPTQELKSPRARSKSLDKPKAKVNRSKSLQDISHKVKMKYSKSYGKKVTTTTTTTATGFGQQRMLTQVDAYGRRPGKYGQYYVDSDSNTGESSDGDDLPLSTLRDRAVTPEPRSCVLDKDDLVDGLRVLLLMDGLFHEGAVKAIRPPDVYGVLIDGERGNRPHIYSQEEILKEAILDVQPGSPRFVPEGTRVCAYWSQQFSCLYPGTVCKASPDPHADPNFVSLEFDDGDSGTIPFDHIRMLPPGYPHVAYDTNPILIVGKRRRRTISEDLEYCRSSTSELSPVPGSTAIKWAKYRTSVSKVKTSWEKGGAKGGNLLELEEEVELKDSVFEAESHQTFGRVVTQEKKQHSKKKHKHRSKDEASAASDSKHKYKKHKKTGKEDKSMRPASAMFSGPDTSFASLAQSEACQTLVSSTKSLGPSGFLLQSTSYEEKTYNWVMRNPLATDRIVSTMEDCESADNTAESVSTTNQDGADSEKSEDNTDVGGQTPVKAQPRGKGRPKSTGEKKKKAERSLSAESKSKIAAFLPTRQLWKWSGKSTKRPGMKGKARKEFYKAIQRGREYIRVGDCAVFLSTGRPNLPFVGRIENFWEAWGGNMVVRVKWFYHPEETKGGKKLPEPKGALFQSPHGDENDVQTISHRCDVLPYLEYNQKKMEAIRRGNENLLDSEELYYLAGNYDPSSNLISYEQHVMG